MDVLILCEGKSDLHFIKGLIKGSHERVKFLEGPADYSSIIRNDFYNKMVYSIGGKGNLPKVAKYLISQLRSEKGKISIVYIKDKLMGNKIIDKLKEEIIEFISTPSKFTQEKPRIERTENVIIVSFKDIIISYHVIGVDNSLEHCVWNKIKDENRDTKKIEKDLDDVHDKINKYCNGKDINDFFFESVKLFNDEEWFTKMIEHVNL